MREKREKKKKVETLVQNFVNNDREKHSLASEAYGGRFSSSFFSSSSFTFHFYEQLIPPSYPTVEVHTTRPVHRHHERSDEYVYALYQHSIGVDRIESYEILCK